MDSNIYFTKKQVNMNLIERVKNILTTPKTEWLVIEGETTTPAALLTSYVLPLALLASLSGVLTGLLWAGTFGMQFWLIMAVVTFISAMIGFFVSSYVIDMLAPSFGSEKNINRSAQLVAYSWTASWIGSMLSFIPVLGWLLAIAGAIYSIYTMYLGLGPIKKTPEDKKVVYLIVSFLVMIVISWVIGWILRSIIFKAMGYSYLGGLGY